MQAIHEQTYKNYEVILVDNGSTDGSIDEIKVEWPWVRLITLKENAGFAKGNNIAAKHARGRWLALLNNDAFPKPDWLSTLMDAAENYPHFSFFGSRLLQSSQPNLLDGTGDVYHVSGFAWRRDYNELAVNDDHFPEEIFSPCGAAALYKRSVFEAAGGFEESFFSYHEDVDLSFRLRLYGYRCLYVPSAVVDHMGSASTGKKSDFAVYYGHRNVIWSFFRNMPSILLWVYLPVHLIANIYFLLLYTFQGRGNVIFRAKKDAILGLPRAIKSRWKIQSERKVSISEIYRVLEHSWIDAFVSKVVRK